MAVLAVFGLLVVCVVVWIFFVGMIRAVRQGREQELHLDRISRQRDLLIEIIGVLERQKQEMSSPNFTPAVIGKHREEREVLRSRLRALDLSTTILP